MHGSHSHGHHDHGTAELGDGRLALAVGINVLLTLAQIVGGIVSGSLALIADALHNLNDAASLGIALFARRLGRRPADSGMTFGYRRAESIAALVNLVTLLLVGVYLLGEAVLRALDPQPVAGWTVVVVAGIALLVDLATVLLMVPMRKGGGANIRVALVHNLTDAATSLAVIAAGALIILYGWTWVDLLLTVAIAAWVLWLGGTMLGPTIRLLMGGTPPDIDLARLSAAMRGVSGVCDVHHLHIWELDEHARALEAHVVIDPADVAAMEQIKTRLKALLRADYLVDHATLEFEFRGAEADCADVGLVAPH